MRSGLHPVMGTLRNDFAGNCVYCSHCQPCPVGIDIAAVNKYLDIARLDAAQYRPRSLALRGACPRRRRVHRLRKLRKALPVRGAGDEEHSRCRGDLWLKSRAAAELPERKNGEQKRRSSQAGASLEAPLLLRPPRFEHTGAPCSRSANKARENPRKKPLTWSALQGLEWRSQGRAGRIGRRALGPAGQGGTAMNSKDGLADLFPRRGRQHGVCGVFCGAQLFGDAVGRGGRDRQRDL